MSKIISPKDFDKGVRDAKSFIDKVLGQEVSSDLLIVDGPGSNWYNFYVWSPSKILYFRKFNSRGTILEIIPFVKAAINGCQAEEVEYFQVCKSIANPNYLNYNYPNCYEKQIWAPIDPLEIFALPLVTRNDNSMSSASKDFDEVFNVLKNQYSMQEGVSFGEISLECVPSPDIYWQQSQPAQVVNWKYILNRP